MADLVPPEALDRIAAGEPYRPVAADLGLAVNTVRRAFIASGKDRVPRPRADIRPRTLAAARLVRSGQTYRQARDATGASLNVIHCAIVRGWGA